MTATVTTRVAESTLKEIDRFSAEKHTDRATMLRTFIEQGLSEERKKHVLLAYRNRQISLQKAASLLGIDFLAMIDLLQTEGLYLDYTEEELREDLKGLPDENSK